MEGRKKERKKGKRIRQNNGKKDWKEEKKKGKRIRHNKGRKDWMEERKKVFDGRKEGIDGIKEERIG